MSVSLHRKHFAQLQSRYDCAQTVLSEVKKYHDFKSALDIGCGVGAWLKAASALGAHRIFGVDGPWSSEEYLCIEPENFSKTNLNEGFDLGEKFDLTISIEVGEHLQRSSAKDFIANLVRHSDVVLFSSAIPGQGGSGHINEDWPSYWAEIFAEHSFTAHDIINTRLWGNVAILPWIQQNCFLYAREGTAAHEKLSSIRLSDQIPIRIHQVTYNRMRRRLAEQEQLNIERDQERSESLKGQTSTSSNRETPVTPPPLSTIVDRLIQIDAQQVATLISNAIDKKIPLSLIRVGHCEAKFLAWPHEFERRDINRTLKRQFGYTTLDNSDILDIAAMIKSAVRASDIIGMPILSQEDIRKSQEGDEGLRLWAAALPACERLSLLNKNQMICSPNIHLQLLKQRLLLELVPKNYPLSFVGCRDLRSSFSSMGFTNLDYIEIPEAARTRKDSDEPAEHHFPNRFNSVIAMLRQSTHHRLYLVGAGVLGKIYCAEARLAGNIAIDIGSVMDLWAGVASRKGHEKVIDQYSLS